VDEYLTYVTAQQKAKEQAELQAKEAAKRLAEEKKKAWWKAKEERKGEAKNDVLSDLLNDFDTTNSDSVSELTAGGEGQSLEPLDEGSPEASPSPTRPPRGPSSRWMAALQNAGYQSDKPEPGVGNAQQSPATNLNNPGTPKPGVGNAQQSPGRLKPKGLLRTNAGGPPDLDALRAKLLQQVRKNEANE